MDAAIAMASLSVASASQSAVERSALALPRSVAGLAVESSSRSSRQCALGFSRGSQMMNSFRLENGCKKNNVSLKVRERRCSRRGAGISAALADVGVKTEDNAAGLETSLPQGETWSVHKFGGTCVGTVERIWKVAGIVVDDPSLRKVVVVSAMSKVTDMMYDLLDKAQSRDDAYLESLENIREKHATAATSLLGSGEDLANFLKILDEDIQNLKDMLRAVYITGHAMENFADLVVGYGELWSAQMLSATVRKRGLPCVWMDARQVLVVSPTSSNQVDPQFDLSLEKLKTWYAESPADTIIVTGFIASTPENRPTTLKRDGSDFSAAIMGALFRAGKVTIWTDVNGVYSADPRKVREAVVLSSLSYQEAWEMSYFGANVLHPRTMIPVMKYRIPITIRNVFEVSAPGTKIWHSAAPTEDQMKDSTAASSVVKGFATIDNMALINVEGTGMAGVPGTASTIFETVRDVGANVVMISQASSEHSVCFALPEKDAMSVAHALESRFRRALDAGRISKVEVVHNCAILAAVGQKMASTPGVSATLFDSLAKANINVRAIAQGCSEYNITVVVNQEDSIRALKAVHSRFYLSKTPLAVGVVGPGLIGATFLQQLHEQASTLKEEFNIDMRVMGIISSKAMILDESRLDLSNWKDDFERNAEPADMDKFTAHIRGNHFLPNKVIVDCTADAGVAKNYRQWLKQGIHIITPNKKGNSGPLDEYLAVKQIQRQSYTHYFYEATVGAGLPIMTTLRGLLETGDKIERIEGIFSGTLSYIFNNFTGDKAFSQVVSEAKEAGYTEPDPRDDLGGVDVARKVIILARESGLKLELEDIPIESLVPKALQGDMSVAEYLEKLPEYDEDMASRRREAEQDGEVLRYVGVVDIPNNEGRVELRRYKTSDSFAQLSGSDNIISFKSKRYQLQPLIVRGPGAGAAVTAAGVFSDVLRLASYLGAPS